MVPHSVRTLVAEGGNVCDATLSSVVLSNTFCRSGQYALLRDQIQALQSSGIAPGGILFSARPNMVECPACSGTGFETWDDVIPCPACDNTGKLLGNKCPE